MVWGEATQPGEVPTLLSLIHDRSIFPSGVGHDRDCFRQNPIPNLDPQKVEASATPKVGQFLLRR